MVRLAGVSRATPARPHTPMDAVLEVLEASLRATSGEVVGDTVQMRMLFQNLIAHALELHREGFPPRVRIYEEPVGSVAPAMSRIVAEARGIGFDPVCAARIFEPLQCLHGQTATRGAASDCRCAAGSPSTTAGRFTQRLSRGGRALHGRVPVPRAPDGGLT